MKLGIIGLPGSGKSTVFEALTGNTTAESRKGDPRIGTVRVPDSRVDILSEMYHPRKTIFGQVEYFLPGFGSGEETAKDQQVWGHARNCDALIQVVRNFKSYGVSPPTPFEDFFKLDQDLILADHIVVEKRIERIEQEKLRKRTIDPDELNLLQECKSHLENEIPLRHFPEIASSPVLKGFAFLSAKPMIVLFNNDDESVEPPVGNEVCTKEMCTVIRGKLEQELSQMPEEEARLFLKEFDIPASAMDRVIQQSYRLMGLISFFTVGEDEVRAWTIRKNTMAIDAADIIHSDIKKGFIRAEVVSYQDLIDSGSYSTARKKGAVRLEGKTYIVQDGDIVHFRFNV